MNRSCKIDYMEFGCGGAECWCVWLKDVWYIMCFIFKRDVKIIMDVVLTCFRFMILVIILRRAIRTSEDEYAYFCCSHLVRCDIMEFMELVAASGKLSAFHGQFSYLECVHRVFDVSSFLPDDLLGFSGMQLAGQVCFTFSFLLRLYGRRW